MSQRDTPRPSKRFKRTASDKPQWPAREVFAMNTIGHVVAPRGGVGAYGQGDNRHTRNFVLVRQLRVRVVGIPRFVIVRGLVLGVWPGLRCQG